MKNKSFITFLSLLFFICIHGVGIYLFVHGFLLTRLELLNQSNGADNPSPLFKSYSKNSHVWLPGQYKRLLLFIIDAWRFDFLQPTQENTTYTNQFKYLTRLLDEEPQNTIYYNFVADPPTTTSQRLKALTTGSLPTFIDIGSNFNSDEIRSDNLIFQFVNHDKKIVALGDGTWKELFNEKYFTRTRLFPSFNMWDLHTVDDGILRYLYAEVASKNLEETYDQYKDLDEGKEDNFEPWDVLIAHFLGVDHAGHKYGVHHPEMSKKLRQMDEVLEKILPNIQNDTLVLIFGDHGMTDNGDHGGGSDIEVNSGMFIYSKKPFSKEIINYRGRNIPQIDIVPTISLLMGIPIPFGNVGKVIPELMTSMNFTTIENEELLQFNELFQKCVALHVNSWQIYNYLKEYVKYDSSFISLLNEVDEIFNKTNEDFNIIYNQKNIVNTEELLNSVANGYLTFLERVRERTNTLWAKFNLPYMFFGIFILVLSIITLIIHTLLKVIPSNLSFYKIFIFLMIINMAFYNYSMREYIEIVMGISCIILILLYWILFIFTSKVQFDEVELLFQPFLTYVSFVLYMVGLLSNSFIVYEDRVIYFFIMTGSLIASRMLFHETNSIYEATWKMVLIILFEICIPLSSHSIRFRKHGTHVIDPKHDFQFSSFKVLLNVFLPAIIYGIDLFYGHGKFVFRKFKRIIFTFYLPIVLPSIFMYWYGMENELLENNPAKILLPQLVYYSFFICFLLWIYFNFNFIKNSLELSISFQILFFIMYPPLMLIQGVEYSFSFLLMMLQTLCFMKIHIECKLNSLWSSLFLWNWFGMQYFFSFGHQNEFSSLIWKSGFIGIDEANMFLSGILIGLNTFGSKFLFTVTIPWLVSTLKDNLNFTEMLRILRRSIFSSLIIQLLPTLVTIINVTIQRRHLMLWAIFVPKFVFDVLSSAVQAFSIIICFILTSLVLQKKLKK